MLNPSKLAVYNNLTASIPSDVSENEVFSRSLYHFKLLSDSNYVPPQPFVKQMRESWFCSGIAVSQSLYYSVRDILLALDKKPKTFDRLSHLSGEQLKFFELFEERCGHEVDIDDISGRKLMAYHFAMDVEDVNEKYPNEITAKVGGMTYFLKEYNMCNNRNGHINLNIKFKCTSPKERRSDYDFVEYIRLDVHLNPSEAGHAVDSFDDLNHAVCMQFQQFVRDFGSLSFDIRLVRQVDVRFGRNLADKMKIIGTLKRRKMVYQRNKQGYKVPAIMYKGEALERSEVEDELHFQQLADSIEEDLISNIEAKQAKKLSYTSVSDGRQPYWQS